MAKQTLEQLGVQPGDQIVVKGVVSFARLDKLVEGEALVAENARRVKSGMIASDNPFRSISIETPTIVQGENTPLANYYAQNVYIGSKSGKPTMSIESKSKFAPTYGHIQNGQLVQIADPEKNPAPGQVVYLMIQAFKPKTYNKLGSSFNAIAFEEGPISFYEGASGGNALAGFGQALNMPVQNGAPVQQAQPQQNGFGQAPVQAPEQQGGFGQAQPQQGGFGQAPVQAPEQQGGFGQAQPQQGGFGGQPTQNDPFGTQPQQGQGSPFDGAGNFGGSQPKTSPFG